MNMPFRPLCATLLLLAAGSAVRAETPRLAFSSFLGGGDVDAAYAVTTDAAGFVYVAGVTLSEDFPDSHPLPEEGPRHDVFVVKLAADGELVWSARFGGSANEQANGIAVSRDRVWVAGWTNSADFPRVGPLAGQAPTAAGDHDAFVAALDPDDGSLLSATNLGGSDDDSAEGIALDGRGNAYVTGGTQSPDFPVVRNLRTAGTGYFKAFVAKLSADGSRLAYSVLLNGNDMANGLAIAVDESGQAVVAGLTSSPDFPVLHAAQPAWGGGFTEGFVAKLAPSGNALLWSTFLGGSGEEQLEGVALDRGGRVWVAGWTTSGNFPVRAALQPRLRGASDAVVAGFGPSGKLIASTYLGGAQDDAASGIAVDASGALHVAGSTTSVNGHPDAFVAKLQPGAAGLVWSTHLGGRDASLAFAVAVDRQGNTWTAGLTEAADFPRVRPLQEFGAGIADAWVTKLVTAGKRSEK
jgi:hypothetical protein